jgi:hypothetical protein
MAERGRTIIAVEVHVARVRNREGSLGILLLGLCGGVESRP